MTGISAGLGIVLVTLQPPVKPAPAPVDLFSRAQVAAATANLAVEVIQTGPPAAPRRISARRQMTLGGVALIAAGASMITFNSIGLASGTIIPPGGERDGYLGKPGVVIGAAFVITGVALIVRAQKP